MGALLNPYLPINQGLQGYWPMWSGSGNKVFDLSGNGQEGSVSGAVWKPGKYGSTLDFVTDDYVEIANSLILAPQNFTIIVGFKADTLATDALYGLVAKWDTGDENNQLYYLAIYDDDSDGDLQIRGAIRDSGAATATVQGITTLITGRHYIAALTYKSGVSLDLYLDDKYEGQDATITNAGVRIGTENLYLGARTGGGSNNFDGLIDFAYLYNCALSYPEIALLYRGPFCGFRWTSIIELASYVAAVGGIPIFRRRRAG